MVERSPGPDLIEIHVSGTLARDDYDRFVPRLEKTLEEWGTKLSRPFFKADMRFFPRDRGDEARRWLRNA